MSWRVTIGTALACLVPLYRLSAQSLWYDELFTTWVVAHSPLEIARETAIDGFTPPLYYFLLAALSRVGLHAEQLRILSVAFGALTLVGGVRLAGRLGGSKAQWVTVIIAGSSPFLISFAQELRPYTAFLACSVWGTFYFVEWWRAPDSRPAWPWALFLLAGAAFSYLGVALLPLACLGAVLSRRPRRGLSIAGATSAVALLLSAPGLRKGSGFFEHRSQGGEIKLETRFQYPLSRLLLGSGVRLAPLADPYDRAMLKGAEIVGAAALGLAIVTAWRRRDRSLAVALSLFVFATASVFVADALTGMGITTRYLTLAFLPFLFALGLSLRWWLLPPVLIAQATGLANYAFRPDYARDDWRSVVARLEREVRSGDLVWGFPAHHLDVAASAYAPRIPVGGGFLGREGEPVYFVKDGARFEGYDFQNLERVEEELASYVRRRSEGRRVFLVTYADEDWHGDTRPLVKALSSEHGVATARFPGREVLILRVFSPP